MSSGFVPAGVDAGATKPDDAWVKAQQLVAQSRSAEAKPGKQDDGKSLYDVLQQNKAAKQEAFEEAARLKNQFRSLDDDEVDFLDSVLESTRAKEAEVRKETAEQLELFRKQREAAEKAQFDEDNAPPTAGGTATLPTTQETWVPRPKKRRRDKEAAPSLGAKLRKTSFTEREQPDGSTVKEDATAENAKPAQSAAAANADQPDSASTKRLEAAVPKHKTGPAATLGLGDYSSDDD